ncbi:tetraspanin-3-like [Strongylocentrotus purpuratus]|uniref:Tetraspanin n=1 Tax=Strongylocentrotus purpuratus TaxID=7668 RepID=A0A7M7PFS4_STRPU|nr:tetraspanin-3-like [Strongylocentrotus purpuratus]
MVVKHVLFFCIWVCSIVLVGIGASVTAKQNAYQDLFSENTILALSWTAIGIGIFIFVVGFCGYCWALTDSSCLGALSEDNMTKGMQRAINETYDFQEGATEAVDDVQRTFECCGASGYKDYKTSKHLQQGYAVPESCCRYFEECTGGSKGNPDYPNRVWTDGCVHATKYTIKNHYNAIGGAAFGILCVKGIGVN